MLDTIDVDSDRKISDHVVRMHRYRSPNEQDGDVLAIAGEADILTTKDLEATDNDDEETPIWEKYDALLHGNSRKKTDKIVSVAFMKKYIHIAKCIKPVLTQDACQVITEEYTKLRANDLESDVAKTAPVTARCLETLIRLATAHAKARLSKVVEIQDAELAIQLVQFAYFKKVETKKGKRARSEDDSGEEEDEGEEKKETPRKRARIEGGDDDAMDETEKSLLTVPAPTPSVAITDERYKHFMSLLNKCFTEKNQAQDLEMPVIKAFFKKEERKNPFSDVEIDSCIEKMAEENKVMLADQTLFMI
jgi:DNA replication licensing factor MCM3